MISQISSWSYHFKYLASAISMTISLIETVMLLQISFNQCLHLQDHLYQETFYCLFQRSLIKDKSLIRITSLWKQQAQTSRAIKYEVWMRNTWLVFLFCFTLILMIIGQTWKQTISLNKYHCSVCKKQASVKSST